MAMFVITRGYVFFLYPFGGGFSLTGALREDSEAPIEAVGEGIPGLVVRDLGWFKQRGPPSQSW